MSASSLNQLAEFVRDPDPFFCFSISPTMTNIGDLVQDCSNSSVLSMELLQSCTKPSTCSHSIKLNVRSLIRRFWFPCVIPVVNFTSVLTLISHLVAFWILYLSDYLMVWITFTFDSCHRRCKKPVKHGSIYYRQPYFINSAIDPWHALITQILRPYIHQ